jgi:hypothetical protein
MTRQYDKRSPRVIVPKPDRVRRIDRAAFGWMDVRLHQQGWLELLAPEALAVYSFLCLVANRQGVSWYRRDRIHDTLGISRDKLMTALQRLYKLDLVAYQPFSKHASEGFHQVLSLPRNEPPGHV